MNIPITMTMRTVITTTLALVVALALIGCKGKDSQSGSKVTIIFWHSFVSSTVPALNDLIAKFEKENPGIEIKAQYIPTGDALLQKLITAVQSKTTPDISWIHSAFLSNLVDAGAIYRIEEFQRGPDSIPAADLNDIYPSLMEAAKLRGTLYSLPMEATNLGLFYNRQMFRDAGLDPKKPPATWDELCAVAQKLSIDRDNDGKFDQLGFFVPISPASGPLGDWMVWQWYPFLWQAGGNEINLEQTKVLYNDEAGAKALGLWKRLYDNLRMRTFTADYDAAFAGKKLAMCLDGPWNLQHYKQFPDLDWAVAPLPAGPAKRATVVGGEYLVIFRESRHPKEAWKFLKWLTGPDVQAFWSMKSGYLPVRHAVMSVREYQEYLKSNDGLRVFAEQMDVSEAPRPVDYHPMELSHNLAVALEKATVGGIDPKTALDEAAMKSNLLLKSVERK